MSLTRLVLSNVWLANSLVLVAAIAGIAVWWQMPVEVYPQVSINRAMVITVWPGGTARDLEMLITQRLEERIARVPHVAWYRSESSVNLSKITVEFSDSAGEEEVESAYRELQAQMGQLADLPEGCQPPTVHRLTMDEEVAFLRLCLFDTSGKDPLALRRAARDLADQLEDVVGVERVSLLGEGEREIRIELNREQLEKHELSIEFVSGVLRRTNLAVPVGSAESGGAETPIRAAGELRNLRDLAAVVVRKDPAGAHVALGEIAHFEEGVAEGYVLARYKGHRCIVLNVLKQPRANTLHVRDRVIGFLEEYRRRHLPEELGVEVGVDLTPWINGALNVLTNNLAMGGVVVLLVLWLFIGLRNSLMAVVGIPFSFLCTLICMHWLGITLNTASAFAMVLVSGMIVDDAIVVLENVHRRRQEGASLREAIITGTDEVFAPIVLATLTTMAAFLPILMMGGVIGRLFSVIPQVVTIALLASLFECLVVLPVHLYEWPGGRPAPGGGRPRNRWSDWLTLRPVGRAVAEIYGRLLGPLLRCRYLVILPLVAMIALAAVLLQQVRVEAVPSEFPTLTISFSTDRQASLEQTDHAGQVLAEAVEAFARASGVVQNHFGMAGVQISKQGGLEQQPHLGQYWVQLQPNASARRDPGVLITQLRDAVERHLQAHPGHGIELFAVAPMNDAPGVNTPIAVRLDHADYEVARQAARLVSAQLAAIPGVEEIESDLQEGPLQVKLELREPLASEFGLTPFDMAKGVRAGNEGLPSGILRDPEHNEPVQLRVLLDRPYRSTLDQLLEIRLHSPLGVAPRLGDVATFGYQQDYAVRRHYNGRRSVLVTARLGDRAVDESGNPVDIRYINQRLDAVAERLPNEIPGLSVVLAGEMQERQASFASLIVAALLATLFIYLILVSRFRNYIQPALVLLTLTFAFVGIVTGLLLHDHPFSVVTAVAVVGLYGVTVNDAIILIDFMNESRRGGKSPLEAAYEGCRLRLRPIVVTTATTVFGLLPMALGLAGYSTIWSPFATTFCYGLVASTLLTLLVTPCAFLILEDITAFFGRLFGAHAARGEEV